MTTAFLQFDEIRKIGNPSANGEVYEVHDPQLNINLAVKKILKAAPDPLVNINVHEEAQNLKKCSHQNIAEIHYACATNEAVFIAMPLYKNGSLQDRIDTGFLTVRQVLNYGREILSGLQHAHVQRLLHLDIKPSNVLLGDNGRAILCDFGCARELQSDNLAESGKMYPLHLVPEKFNGKMIAIEADIYLVGLTLFRLCNGDLRFFDPIGGHKKPEELQEQKTRDKINAKIRKGKFPNRDLYLPHIPLTLKKVINTAINVEPSDRFSTAAEFHDALASVNSCLDWQYEEHTLGKRTWNFTEKETTIEATLVPGKTGFDVETTKTIATTGKPQFQHEFCGKNLSESDAESLISRLARTQD